MQETKAGPAEGPTCVRDPKAQEEEYITVSVQLPLATVMDVAALVPKAGPGKSSFDIILRLCTVTGVEYYKAAEAKPAEGGGATDANSAAEPPDE